jgi:hypothetical protein
MRSFGCSCLQVRAVALIEAGETFAALAERGATEAREVGEEDAGARTSTIGFVGRRDAGSAPENP